jgi:PAS domain S-box-containing protein
MTQEKIQTTVSGNGNADENIDSLLGEDIAPFWLSALIDSADDAIISKTLDGIITSWNKGAERIFGYRAEEVIGKPVLILIPPDHYNEEPEILGRIRAGERVEHYETIRVRKDGSTVDISLTVSPIRKPDGRIIGASKIARDISALKQAEARLRESEARFAKAFDASPLVLTISSLETGRLLEVNETFVNATGFSREEAIGKTTVELGLWAKPTEREEEMETVRQIGHVRNAEYVFQTRNGEIIGLLSAEHIQIGGESFALTVIQDITEHKRAEQERERLLLREQIARQQAEEASRLKDEFLATVSHEIRTPLNAILGWSQMLMTKKINPNDMQGAIETIYRNAKSQAQLIEDILDVSRIITGKIRLEPHPISLAPLIQTAVESLRPAIEAKNIRLQMRLDFEPRMVSADPNRLQQVVWNLVSNAIKFTPEKGSVSIELESDASRTKIIVSDTGKGIDAEFLPFVFERFRQADGSSTRKHGGLGLGLAIVRHIVELHGGSVEVNSEGADKGTTFTVYLPLAQFPVSDAGEKLKLDSGEAQTSVYDSKIKGLRILLIDDEADTLDLLGVILKQSGAEVKSESTAAGGLEILKQWQPDVIISDIAMPVEDGYSFIKKLRTLPPEQGGTIPVIALTAYVGIKERTQILSSGFQMYVPKPIEPSELVGALANFV